MPLRLNDRRKYANFAQLVQGVNQVEDPSLSLGERCFLNCLAAHSVSGDPFPGNERLQRACGGITKQGVQKIARKLIDKKLIERLAVGNGRGKATVYRICFEDPRFPLPKRPTPRLSVSPEKEPTPGLPVSDAKRPTGNLERANCDTGNSQLDDPKRPTLELHTDVKNRCKEQIEAAEEAKPAAAAASPVSPPDPTKKQTRIRAAFASIALRPIGSPEFQDSWLRNYEAGGLTVDAMEAVYQEIGSSKVPPPFTQAKRELERQEAEKRRYNGNGNGHAPAREPSKLHIRCGGCGKSNWVRRAGEMNKCRNCGYVPAQRSDDMGQLVPARIQKISKDGIVLADQDAPTRYVVALK